MVRRILIFLLILCPILAFSQPLPAAENDWPLCFDESAWNALEEQIWAETEQTVVEAVNAAVAPYRITVDRMEWELKWWKVGFWAAVAAAGGSLLWAALK
jgi:hypothetical protein